MIAYFGFNFDRKSNSFSHMYYCTLCVYLVILGLVAACFGWPHLLIIRSGFWGLLIAGWHKKVRLKCFYCKVSVMTWYCWEKLLYHFRPFRLKLKKCHQHLLKWWSFQFKDTLCYQRYHIHYTVYYTYVLDRIISCHTI